MELKRIASFQVDHTKIGRGIYTSRIDGDITTYDIRMVKPNCPPYLANDVIHTIEHLFATFVRSSEFSDNIVYFGPMGCRTGFYFITRGIDESTVIMLIKRSFEFIAAYDGEIPGTSEVECGNYAEHNLTLAKNEAANFLPVIKNYKPEMLAYNA